MDSDTPAIGTKAAREARFAQSADELQRAATNATARRSFAAVHQMHLTHAAAFVGACTTMCPPDEVRERENMLTLSRFEQLPRLPGEKHARADFEHAIKVGVFLLFFLVYIQSCFLAVLSPAVRGRRSTAAARCAPTARFAVSCAAAATHTQRTRAAPRWTICASTCWTTSAKRFITRTTLCAIERAVRATRQLPGARAHCIVRQACDKTLRCKMCLEAVPAALRGI